MRRFFQSPAQFFLLIVRDKYLMLLVFIAGFLALGFIIHSAISIGHWRHDSYLYRVTQSLLYAVRTEGRWLAYLSARCLQTLDPLFMWIGNLLLIFISLSLIFRRLFSDNYVAINLALIAVMFPGLYAMNMWPMGTFAPSVLLLASVVVLLRLGLYVLPLVAILLFATMPWFYYILPLAIIPLGSCRSPRDGVRLLFPGVLWGLSLLGAYLFAAVVNYYRFDYFGIDLDGGWRELHLVTDVASLVGNIQRNAALFATQVADWLPPWLLCLSVAGLIACLAFKRQHKATIITNIIRAGYVLVVMLSPYLTTVFAGIGVQYRSLLPMAIGIIVLPYVLTDRALHRRMILVTALVVGVPSFLLSYSGVDWYARVTAANLSTLAGVIPTTGYKSVAVDARNTPLYYALITKGLPRKPFFMEPLDAPMRLTPALYELGFTDVMPCPRVLTGRMFKACQQILEEYSSAKPCVTESELACMVSGRKGLLVIRLAP